MRSFSPVSTIVLAFLLAIPLTVFEAQSAGLKSSLSGISRASAVEVRAGSHGSIQTTPDTGRADQTRAFYEVRSGDTLYSISERFEVPVAVLRHWNDLGTTTSLEEGTQLRVRPTPADQSKLTDSISSGDLVPPSRSSSRADSSTSQGLDSSADTNGRPSPPSSPDRQDTVTGAEPLEPPTKTPSAQTSESSSSDSSPVSGSPSTRTGSSGLESDPSPTPRPGAIPDRVKKGSPLHDKIEQAAATYSQSGDARVLKADDDEQLFPYGKEVPIVDTPVLHFSTVKLAKNEYVTNMNIGDRARWTVTTGSMGTKGDFQQMVHIKPQQCGPMQTNLMLATNQGRTYDLILKSIPCDMAREKNPDMDQWDRVISYYYPDGRSIGPSNMNRRMPAPAQAGSPRGRPRVMSPQSRSLGRSARSDSAMRRAPQQAVGQTPSPPASRRPIARQRRQPMRSRPNPGRSGSTSRFRSDRRSGSSQIDLRDVRSEQYEIDMDRGFPCKPDFIGDDGERTYVRLGDDPGCSSTFPFYVVKDRGQLQVTNYNVFNGSTYVVEGVYPKTALVVRESEGGDTKRVTFTNTDLEGRRR